MKRRNRKGSTPVVLPAAAKQQTQGNFCVGYFTRMIFLFTVVAVAANLPHTVEAYMDYFLSNRFSNGISLGISTLVSEIQILQFVIYVAAVSNHLLSLVPRFSEFNRAPRDREWQDAQTTSFLFNTGFAIGRVHHIGNLLSESAIIVDLTAMGIAFFSLMSFHAMANRAESRFRTVIMPLAACLHVLAFAWYMRFDGKLIFATVVQKIFTARDLLLSNSTHM